MNQNKTRVTLEDLLRVKRAEQPPANFWSEFDREMRAKQLAAIVEPRPWWAPFIRVGARAARYHVPMGAAAVLAVSFISISEYRSPSSQRVPLAPASQAVTVSPVVGSNAVAASYTSAAHESDASSAVAVETRSDVSEAVLASDESAALANAGRASHAMPLPDAVEAELEPTPSARYIAANLAAAQAADPRIMDDVFGPSVRSVETRQPVRDPLTQIAAPGESRRSRLMESALPAPANSGDVAVGTSDRVARRLTEERLYDTIRRIGLQGDRVAFKF